MTLFFHKLLGFGLTGEVSEQLFVLWTGGGSNGKSFLASILSALMKKFYVEMNSRVLLEKYNGNRDAEIFKTNKGRLIFLQRV